MQAILPYMLFLSSPVPSARYYYVVSCGLYGGDGRPLLRQLKKLTSSSSSSVDVHFGSAVRVQRLLCSTISTTNASGHHHHYHLTTSHTNNTSISTSTRYENVKQQQRQEKQKEEEKEPNALFIQRMNMNISKENIIGDGYVVPFASRIVTQRFISRQLFHDGDDLLGDESSSPSPSSSSSSFSSSSSSQSPLNGSTGHTNSSSSPVNECSSGWSRPPVRRVPLAGVWAAETLYHGVPIHILPEGLTASFMSRQREKDAKEQQDYTALREKHIPGWMDSPLRGDDKQVTGTAELLDQFLLHNHNNNARSSGHKKKVEGEEEEVPSSSFPLSAPFLLNRVTEPNEHISLRRFLAVRHCWQSGRYFHIPTPNGWYLLTPSWLLAASPIGRSGGISAAVRSGEEARLHSWCRNLHPRFEHLCASNEKEHEEEEEETLQGRGGKERGKEEDAAAVEEEEEDRWIEEKDGSGVVGSGTVSAKALQLYRIKKSLELHEASGAPDWERPTCPPKDEPFSGVPEGDYVTRKLKKILKNKKKRSARKGELPYIPESHLFELNDGIQWPIHPLYHFISCAASTPLTAEGLLSLEEGAGETTQSSSSTNASRNSNASSVLLLWREVYEFYVQHISRLRVYEENGDGWSLKDEEEFVASAVQEWSQRIQPGSFTLSVDGEVIMHDPNLPSQADVAHFSRRLFRAYTQKANVELVVEEETGLLTLVPLFDIAPGTELCLHYGREWWTEHLLYPLLLLRDAVRGVAVKDKKDVVKDDSAGPAKELAPSTSPRDAFFQLVTAAEHFTTCPSDVFEPFPRLQARRHKRKTEAKKQEKQLEKGKYYLYNASTHVRASHAAVVATAVQHSILYPSWWERLLTEVFDANEPDKEVPVSTLRRALLRELVARKRRREGSEQLLPLPTTDTTSEVEVTKDADRRRPAVASIPLDILLQRWGPSRLSLQPLKRQEGVEEGVVTSFPNDGSEADVCYTLESVAPREAWEPFTPLPVTVDKRTNPPPLTAATTEEKKKKEEKQGQQSVVPLSSAHGVEEGLQEEEDDFGGLFPSRIYSHESGGGNGSSSPHDAESNEMKDSTGGRRNKEDESDDDILSV